MPRRSIASHLLEPLDIHRADVREPLALEVSFETPADQLVVQPCPTIQNSHDVLSTRTTYVHHLVLVGELLGKAEIIEEVLDGDARAVEARSAAHPFGVSP